jgi:hypothetical protein
MKLASFDLEIAAVVPPDVKDWAELPDLGISCAAVAFSDRDDVRFWSAEPRLSATGAADLVRDLQAIVGEGYRLVTWNGCAFDFRILAQESGLVADAGRLALDHVDLMLMVTFSQGHYLGLHKALLGAGLTGKLKQVRLSDGNVLEDMDGSKAPLLWAQGEHDAVLAYLEQDVVQQLALAGVVAQRRAIQWTSNRGAAQVARFSGLLSVQECFALPEPDTSWMSDPPTRQQFVDWMGAG